MFNDGMSLLIFIFFLFQIMLLLCCSVHICHLYKEQKCYYIAILLILPRVEEHCSYPTSLHVTFFFRTTCLQLTNDLFLFIGVGADDTFILVKAWRAHSKMDPNLSSLEDHLESMVGSALGHSMLTMCVTSFTTSAAFFASFISTITAIKCFRYVVNVCGAQWRRKL